MEVIVFENEEGISVMYPTGELSVLDTAKKDVPQNKPFWIVDNSFLPSSREFRVAWKIDTNSIGEPSGVGEYVAEYSE